MTGPRQFRVDADRTRFFDTLEEARTFAQWNFPAVILQRTVLPDGHLQWREVLRFDWRWNEALGRPEIGFG